jgi:hypothetical protein
MSSTKRPDDDSRSTRARGVTVRDFCEREGIDRSTAWRWVSRGVVEVSRLAPRMGVRVTYRRRDDDR